MSTAESTVRWPRSAPPGSLAHAAEEGIRALIALAGDDPHRAGLIDTPGRWTRAILELIGPPGDDEPTAAQLMSRVFPDVPDTSEPVTVGPIPFRTVCEHHLLPFTGAAWIAYTPSPGRTVGLSKLPRLVALHARQLNVQEAFTRRIAADLAQHLEPVGYSVGVVAEHTCTTLRGARAAGTMMRTYAFGGTHDTPGERARLDHLTAAARP
jgi:GTP cyclohydrolase I